ncbi:MFS transporter [Neptunicella marina]|uniref:MFS transporter n=1 Tax=Neptunicella marina TaxID=2125989 RepID=A0A8J6IX40_9ALTE|nr:MFS transporter [Neptunicella marina]MBC3767252.1 MFS transporter [Neptunicella marina]
MQKQKPELSFWQIWNLCFGYFGIQFGFSLQNANFGRIFETLGASYSNMAILFVAAPITGLIVQPLIGHMSDRTWNRFGRRSPYFLGGALAASAALFIMPNSPMLWVAAGMLWIMDASINVCMEPTRAFVGDMLPKQQRPLGYAMQTLFIGIASVIASALPWLLTNYFGVSNSAAAGVIPDSVKYAFYSGASIMLIAVGWTFFTTQEYSPEQLKTFAENDNEENCRQALSQDKRSATEFIKAGKKWVIGGLISALAMQIFIQYLHNGVFILALSAVAFGLCQFAAGYLLEKNAENGFTHIMQDLFAMPPTMKKLASVQFFSWFPFFAMWAYLTAAVTSFHFGTTIPTDEAYNQGANWAGMLHSTYNAATILAAILIPLMVRRFSLRFAHIINLCLGGLGFISFAFIQDPDWLLLAMTGVGFAWASILGMPYVLLSNAIPYQKMGVYMGISNLFIVLPQIVAASVLGMMVHNWFNDQPIYAIVAGGVSMLIAALLTLRIKDE